MIKKILITQIRKALIKFEFDIVKRRIIDFNKDFNFSNLNFLETNIITNYKLNNLITTAGKRLGSFEDPYFFALKHASYQKDEKKFIEIFVKKIKSIIKAPRTAAEAIGMNKSKKLSLYPEWALVLPWENKLIAEAQKSYLIKLITKRKELKSYYSKNMNLKNINKIIYHDQVWKSHGEQFFKLYKSIAQHGFKQTEYIPVSLFRYKNLYKCSLSEDGNHRARIAYILGMKTIPLKISKIIDLKDIEEWTNVKNKLYHLNDARKIFKSYFNFLGNGTYV